MTHLQIRLYRDSFNTPWGFRLQGGNDVGQPLSVQRVFSNSPAEGELQRGDLILAIGGRDGNELTHKQALDLIKHGGGQIQLVIQRPLPGQVTSSPVSFKPQRPRAPSLQQPPPSQPPTSYGFQPRKINLSSLGGGGPSFGSDYTGAGGYRPSVTQPVHVHTGPKSPGHNVEMLNKVQESLDNISLSPRTPDYGYQQSPVFPGSSPGGAEPYIPTGVRLDMQREEEQRRKQYMKEHPPYVPTSAKIDQQMAASGKSLSPRSPGAVSWSRPAHGNDDVADGGPAWKSTLKPTSVKPWDVDLDYVPSQHQAPQSSGFTPPAMMTSPHAAPYNPVAPAPQPQNNQEGPKVVHLQYNSPMGLYSNQNIQETYAGQTKAMAATGALSPGGTQLAQNGGMGGRPGERDWNQSAVFRMIHEDDARSGQRPPPSFQPQPYQQYRPPPPQPAFKPQVQTFQQSFGPPLDELGTSDF